MATRSTKTGSAGVEFAAAPQPWQIAELDSDLDALFTNIDNTNVKAGAGIATSKLASDAGIVTGMLAPLAVTTAKLAAGAAINQFVTVDATPGTIIGETTVALLPSMTTRGGKVILFGNVSMLHLGSGGTDTLTLRLYHGVTGVSLFRTITYVASLPGASTAPIPCPALLDSPGAGVVIYKLTAQASTGQIIVNATNPGSWYAVEFA